MKRCVILVLMILEHPIVLENKECFKHTQMCVCVTDEGKLKGTRSQLKEVVMTKG